MFYEYALEPTVLSSWERTRYFLDAMGPWKGKFVAEYPKHWVRLVLRSLACGEYERKRIVQRLEQAKKARAFFRRSGAPYDGTKSWIDNVEVEHTRIPFHAVIASEAKAKDFVLDAAHLDENDARWKIDQGRLVPRDSALFAHMLDLLFRASSRVVIVDPYFRAHQPDKTRPLTAFCNLLRGRGATLEIHFADNDQLPGYARFMTDAARALPGVVPSGSKVTLHCWKERAGGPRLHNRYVLTDVAGVQFGDSIEQGDVGHQDRVSILEEVSRASLWQQFLGTPGAFDRAGPPKEFEGRRSVR